MATIKDIAAALGISRGTVDRALHGRDGIRPDVKRRVLEKAEELGYRTNRASRMLSMRKKPLVAGCLLPSIGNPFFDEVKRGMEDAASEYADSGLSLMIEEVEGFDKKEHLDAISRLAEVSDALILTTLDDGDIRKMVESSSLPFAALNSRLSSESLLFYSGPDYGKKGRLNAGMLRLVGKEKPCILILYGSDGMYGHREAIDAFLRCLQAEGVRFSIAAIRANDDSDTFSERIVREETGKESGIDTIFVVSGGAEGAVKGSDGKERLVFTSDTTPEVLALLKDGRIAWTVSQDPYSQGYESVKRMFHHLLFPEETVCDYEAEHSVKIRESLEETE